jgi:cytochrome c-type biogenesis protein CcmH
VSLPNNPFRLKSSLLILFVASLCVAQIPSLNLTEPVKRVGSRLRCMCGVCRNTMADCPMLGCHSAVPAREKIAKMQGEGKDDDFIVASFVKDQGKQVLSVPPTEGFSLLSWLLPPVFLLGGLGAIYFWIQRNRRVALPVDVPAEALDKFRKQADEELAKFDQ